MNMKERSMKLFEGFKKKSEEMLLNVKAVNRKLDQARKKMNKVDQGPILEMVDNLRILLDLVRSWLIGEYRSIPTITIVTIFAAVLYFVSPLDAIADFIPFGGLLDDGFVLGIVIGQVGSEIKKYKIWRDEQGENTSSQLCESDEEIVIDIDDVKEDENECNETNL